MRKNKRNVFVGIPVSAQAPGFPSPVVSRQYDRDGMAYAMLYQTKTNGVEGVVPIERQSLRQPILRHRIQVSRYLLTARTGAGLQKEIGYPTPRGQTIINTVDKNALRRGNIPVTSGRAPARQGLMAAPPRFRKALPVPVVTFNPPVYGGS